MTGIEQNRLEDLKRTINATHAAADRLAKTTREKAAETITEVLLCGQALAEAKAIVEHGKWLDWLGGNCPGVTERTAQKYMRLSNANHGSDLTTAKSLRQAYIDAGIIRDEPTREQSAPTPAKKDPEPTEPEREYPDAGRVFRSTAAINRDSVLADFKLRVKQLQEDAAGHLEDGVVTPADLAKIALPMPIAPECPRTSRAEVVASQHGSCQDSASESILDEFSLYVRRLVSMIDANPNLLHELSIAAEPILERFAAYADKV